MPYAHSRNRHGRRHDLVAHLHGVAQRAAEFAAFLEAADLGYFLGWWHDLGKFSPAWQRYLLDCEVNPARSGHGPDHKAAGTQVAFQHLRPLALLTQGHHGGLKTPTDVKAWLDERSADPEVKEGLARARRAVPRLDPAERLTVPDHTARDYLKADLFLRLLYSALVDADYLDTEAHADDTAADQRGSDISVADLWERFEAHQRAVLTQPDSAVNRARAEMYQACLDSADLSPGLFRLGMPTGGGKTLSAMAFALRHALHYGHRRVVVAVPFISITEQTADVYRRVFDRAGDRRPVVLEHHSGADYDESEHGDFRSVPDWARLAAENWDAPVVVTTTVQLFQSLFACRPSAMRKLHRLARSVIILDEAQTLPAHLLTPILDALRQLCAHYGTTVVISTATQPAFDAIPSFHDLGAREIVPNAPRYFQVLKRVQYEWLTDPSLSWEEVAALIADEPQAVAVLNTKKDALALLDALGDGDALHLSTLLCGAHRRAVLGEVRRRLAAGEPCRLVSTQVIEAGVDLDFPLALRALGPLDAIIQTAGRCNREGKLASGRVVVFCPRDGGLPPSGTYRMGAGITGTLLGSGDLDPDDPAHARRYFECLVQSLGQSGTDREHIQDLRRKLNYPEAAARFRMIDDDTVSVAITNYGSEAERASVRRILADLRRGAPNGRLLRRQLQPHIVSVFARQSRQYARQGLIDEISPGLGEWLGHYDPVRGLVAASAQSREVLHSSLEMGED